MIYLKELTFVCDHTIFDDYKYKIFENDKILYRAEIDLYSAIKNFIESRFSYKSKISLFDLEDKEIVSIFSYSPLPLNDKLFSIKIDDEIFYIREGKNFRIPDLYVRTNLGKLSIFGKLSSQEFKIGHDEKILASINASFNKNVKKYKLRFEDDYLDYEKLFISIVLILDNLYHDY